MNLRPPFLRSRRLTIGFGAGPGRALGLGAAVVLASWASGEAAVERPGLVREEYVFTASPTRDCHASSLVELANGDLLCTWFGGSKEGAADVRIWLSRKPRRGTWSVPVSVAHGEGKTVYNPVIYQPRGGDLTIAYCSPDINTGQVITSQDDGHSWSHPRQLPAGFTGPIVNKPVQLPDGTLLAPASLQNPPGKRVHLERSTDNGRSWTRTPALSDPHDWNVIQPTILVHTPDLLQLLMRNGRSEADTKIVQSWSEDGGHTWSPLTRTALPNNNSAIDAVSLRDGRHLLVYNHSTREDPLGGRKGRGILTVALTRDGVDWEAALVLEYRPGNVQYSYPAVIQTQDGLVHVTYSWHRQRIKHVVIDPAQLVTYPIVDGRWPRDQIPWFESVAPGEVNDAAEVLN